MASAGVGPEQAYSMQHCVNDVEIERGTHARAGCLSMPMRFQRHIACAHGREKPCQQHFVRLKDAWLQAPFAHATRAW